jgi:hypothetical protein
MARKGRHKLVALARGQVCTRLRPLDQITLAIANRTTDSHKGRAIAAHPGFGEPRFTNPQKVSGLARREKTVAAVRLVRISDLVRH